MAFVKRIFYRTSRGPTPNNEDVWSLVFDSETRRLLVRREWLATGHSGFDEFDVAQFLEQEGAAQAVLIDDLFAEQT